MKRIFGRRAQFDERSREYPVRAMVARNAAPRSYTWSCPLWLDQKSEGACVGFAITHEAAARPVVVPNMSAAVARKLYAGARKVDEWPGENYEGTSVLAGMKVATEWGWYSEYRWAFGEADLAIAVSRVGPAVLGIEWYEGMSEPDRKTGVVRLTGAVQGGHAILCTGYSVAKRMYRLHNSWGTAWGRGGDCFISAADMAKLLARDGEACIPVKRRMPR